MESYRFQIIIGEKGNERLEEVDGNDFTVGRSREAGVCIPFDVISREQLKIFFDGKQLWAEELGSSNGSWIDQKRMNSKKRIKIQQGQKIFLGNKEGIYIKVNIIGEENEKPISIPEWNNKTEASITKRLGLKETKVEIHQQFPDRILQIKSESEQKLFDYISNVVGSEAEEIRIACLDEASRIKKHAEEYSLNQFREARDKADKILKEAEHLYFRKTTDLKNIEEESQRRLDNIRGQHFKLEKDVQDLKDSEYRFRAQLNDLEATIKREESRIKDETLRLENSRSEFQKAKSALELSIEENEIAIRRTKAKIETEELEAKIRMTQSQSEIDKLQSQKSFFESQIYELKQDKQQLDTSLFDIKNQVQHQESILSEIKYQRDHVALEYEQTKNLLEEAKKEVRQGKDELNKFQIEIDEKKIAAEKLLEEAKLSSELTLAQANEQLLILENRKSHLSKEVESHYIKLKEDQEKVLVRLGDKKTLLVKEMERIAVAGHEEYHKIIHQGQTEAQSIKEQTQLEVSILKKVASEEIESLRNIVSIELEQLRESTKDEVQKMLIQAQSDAQVLVENGEQRRLDSERKARLTIDQAESHIQAEKRTHLDALAIIEQKKKNANAYIDSALLEKERILSEAKAKATEYINQSEKNAQELRQHILETAKAESKTILIKGEEELNGQKTKQQNLLTELKHAEMLKIKTMKAEAEEEWINKRNERARSVSTNVFALVASEMYKARNKVLDEHFVDTFSRELKELIVDTMLERVGADSDKLQNILKTSEDAKNKEKRFWRKVQISAVAAGVILAVMLIFPKVLLVPRDMVVSAFSKKETNNSDQFLEQIKQARVKAVYAPEQSVEYKDSYVDNILFTKDFEARVSEAVFQDKWILDLNDWFIKDLDVKDTTIVKFVSLESGLIKELGQMKLQIEAENPGPGIELMRQKEDEYKQKLSELFGDPNKVSRFYEYTAKFWNNYYNPRTPATTSPEFVDPVNVE